MKFWDDIKEFFYRKRLAKRVAEISAQRSIINIQEAGTIGIVYDSTNPGNDTVIAGFAAHLKKEGKQVEILGFVNDKKIDAKPGILVFNTNNLSWAGVPGGGSVEKFAEKRFDLLLVCLTGENLPVEYMAGISKAGWRVGPYSSDKTELYDMMINVSGKTDLPYLLEQMTSFLSRIKAA